MNNASLSDITSAISEFFNRFHFITFIILVVGSLTLSIFFLNQNITTITSEKHDAPTPAPPFDKQTIEKIKTLRQSTNNENYVFPPGRINPLVE